jgi:tRNA A37 N6-isopentenylltransferase MiaA
LPEASPSVLYICGPTGGGKTALSIDISRHIPNAIFINADTMQMYQGLECMSGTPSPAELSQIEHRLFGVLRSGDACSRSRWLDMAKHEIEDALAQGKIPILIGGSRSFAAELAKAAYGLQLDVTMDNAITYPQEGTTTHFPYQLSAIVLAPPANKVNAGITYKIANDFDLAIDAVTAAKLAGHDFQKGAGITIGTREINAYLDGSITRQHAIETTTIRAIRYAEEQYALFAKLEDAINQANPGSALRITSTVPDERVRQAIGFIQKHFTQAASNKWSHLAAKTSKPIGPISL